MQGLKEVQTSTASGKKTFLKYGQYHKQRSIKICETPKCEPFHEKLRARTECASMLQ